jgi:hypothetical protein
VHNCPARDGPATPGSADTGHTWYVWDRNGYLLRIEATHQAALEWAHLHSGAVTIGTRIDIGPHDYWYILTDPTNPVGDFQARIIRADHAATTNLYTGQQPRYPHTC